jgi:hypothetical protein
VQTHISDLSQFVVTISSKRGRRFDTRFEEEALEKRQSRQKSSWKIERGGDLKR